jgi:hypothetical protein
MAIADRGTGGLGGGPFHCYAAGRMIPKRVILIVLYFAALGGSALSTMWKGLFDGTFFLHLEVFMLPVAYGLLRGKSNSHNTAQIWLFAGYVASGVGLWGFLTNNVIIPPGTWMGRAITPAGTKLGVIALLAGNLALNLTFHVLILTRKAKDFFKRNKIESGLLLQETKVVISARSEPVTQEAEVISTTSEESVKPNPA